MQALILGEGGPTFADIPQPTIRASEVLVRVHACALNRADLAMAQGHLHGAAGGRGNALGMEWAGDIVATGTDVPTLRSGDHVMGSGAGAFAEYAKADYGRVLPMPDVDMPYEQAATLPVALQTMHDAVVTNGALVPGEAVLIQGASSGVGLMGLRIARAMGAALVIGTSTNPARRAQLADYGADLSLDPNDSTWVQQVLDATDSKGVHLIVDQVAGGAANDNMRATRVLGRIVNVGRLGGMRGNFDFDLHALRRIRYIGVTFRTRTNDEVREIRRRLRHDLWPALTRGDLRLPIDRVYPFADAPAALAHMAANDHFGKIVLRL